MAGPEGGNRTLDGLRALVAEDDFHICLVIEAALKGEGMVVIGAATRLDEALAMARSEAPDVAVVDIRLGDEDSFPLIRHLRGTGVRVVLATGDQERAQICAELAELPVLKKPYTADQLIEVIRSLF
jgi:DNA-binding response OmpR family regulator